MWRAILCVALCLAALPARAGVVDDILAQLYDVDGERVNLKPMYRACASEGDCTAVLSLCRWRAVSKNSEKQVNEISGKAVLECKWPTPPATPPAVQCISNLCTVPSDGKYY
jgi:hypothetical protein